MSVFLDGKDALSAGLRGEALGIRLQTASLNPQFEVNTTTASYSIDTQGRLRLADPLQFTITGITSATTFTRVTLLSDSQQQNEMIELALDTPVTFSTNGTFTFNDIVVDYA